MDSNSLVFDISSDDDDALPAWKEPIGEDYNWLSEVLDAVGKKLEDPDDVVVVREVNPNKRLKLGNSTPRKVVDDDDDDCVILEGDPDKALTEDNDSKQDSDELIIVGQKGQIACRDFPHPRHDCGTFPFSSTSHDQHCELCHCFVCDTRAPCPFWYSGNCIIDHCHANAKEEIWKNMRRTFRVERNGTVPVSKALITSTAVPQVKQAPRRTVAQINPASCHNIIRLTAQNQVSRQTTTHVAGNCNLQTQVPRPSILRQCPSASRYAVPCHPNMESRHVLNKNTMQPHSVPPPILGVHKSSMQKEINNWGSQFVSSNTMAKRPHTGFSSSIKSSAHTSQYQPNPASVSKLHDMNPIGWSGVSSDTNLGTYTHQSSSHLSMDAVLTNSEASQPSVYMQPVPPSNDQQAINQLQNQNQAAPTYGLPDFGFNWNNTTGPNNQEASLDCLQLQTSASTNVEEPFKEANEGEKSYLKELENILLDNQHVPEASLTGDLTAMPPEHVGYDTALLYFDIGTSWDPLTRA